MFKGKSIKSVKYQMLHYMVQEKNIKIYVVLVQQQQNGFDCGVYAITFMVSFVNKKDLTSISFDENCFVGSFIWLLQTRKANNISKCKGKCEKEYCKIDLLWVNL